MKGLKTKNYDKEWPCVYPEIELGEESECLFASEKMLLGTPSLGVVMLLCI